MLTCTQPASNSGCVYACALHVSRPSIWSTLVSNIHHSSLILWEFCLRHPEVRDVCDIGQMIFWNQKWAWWFTAVMFLLNNTVGLPSRTHPTVSPQACASR